MSYIRDLLGLAGIGLALFGLWQWSTALACVAGGGVLLAGSFLWSFARGKVNDR